MRWEVETDLIIHTKIKIIVDADSKESAIDQASEILPSNFEPEKSKKWKAVVELRPPKGIEITAVKPYHFEHASGADKAKRLT